MSKADHAPREARLSIFMNFPLRAGMFPLWIYLFASIRVHSWFGFSGFLIFRHIEIGDRAFKGLGGHGYCFRQGGMRMNGQGNIPGIGAHFDG